MTRRYTVDTNCLIWWFPNVFEQEGHLSRPARKVLYDAFAGSPDTLLSIPSIVFVEVFTKWCHTEEFAARFRHEVLLPARESDSIEIRPIDAEVVERLAQLGPLLPRHDLHDKLVLASAMVLQCPLITHDGDIRECVSKHRVIPGVLG